MSFEINFMEKFGNSLTKNVSLSNYSWFNLGGKAEYFYKAKNKIQLKEFLAETKKINLKTTILGAGSNTLFRDNGVKGATIKLGKAFSYVNLIDKDIIEVGAATLDRKIANYAKDNNLGNFEFLSCIPGSIGGAIIMNSGCYENDISKVLVSLQAIDKKRLTEIEIKKEDIKFSYRGTDLSDDLIIISAKLKGSIGKKNVIEKKQLNFIEIKKLSQPSQIKTCGSTFKNISKDLKAWKLIKKAGCDQLEEGDAVISQKHCNFFVNKGNAKSSDIEKLIKKVKKKVFEETGKSLELEIKIVGE
jgi:UDP-N-acetylmuramate dehydrogenase